MTYYLLINGFKIKTTAKELHTSVVKNFDSRFLGFRLLKDLKIQVF